MACLLNVACTSLPEGCRESLPVALHNFIDAVTQKNVSVVIKNFQAIEAEKPVEATLQLMARSGELNEVKSIIEKLDFDFLVKEQLIYATAELPNREIVTMVYKQGIWYFVSLN